MLGMAVIRFVFSNPSPGDLIGNRREGGMTAEKEKSPDLY